MTKAELRKKYLTKQKNLTPSEIQSKNEFIVNKFFEEINLSEVKFLHTFLPILKNNEVNTWLIIRHLQNNFPHIQILIPRTNLETLTLESSVFTSNTQLTENKWSISEPVDSEEVSPEEIDLVIVPLLCFDKKNFRVGYGKGFYDRFLASCRKNVKKIGLSYFPPVSAIDNINEWDIALDVVIAAE